MNNREIIERYYRAHKDELLAFVSTHTQHSPEAEDLVHDAFLRLLSGHRPISEVTMPSLVYTLCRNLIVDWYRRHTIRRDYAHTLACVSGRGDSAESLLSMRETKEQLEQGLMHVSQDCRELYLMHIFDGMKAADISLQTGLPYRSVEYKLGQARKQVRNHLKHIS